LCGAPSEVKVYSCVSIDSKRVVSVAKYHRTPFVRRISSPTDRVCDARPMDTQS
jgi:hypothetical protein